VKNTFFLSILVLLSLSLSAQQRKPIKGKLLYKNTNVIAANVINNSAQINTITDDTGEFEIPVALGDEVIFSSLQYRIRAVVITEEILNRQRLIVSVNENVNELNEIVVTPENTEKFLDLIEEEFKGYDYERDKSSQIVNEAYDERVLKNGLDFVNIAKLIAMAVSKKTPEERNRMKPSEILPMVFDDAFFESDLKLKKDEVVGYLEYIDKKMTTNSLLNQDRKFQLIEFLIDQSIDYKKSLDDTN
jgi:hypothetical protein